MTRDELKRTAAIESSNVTVKIEYRKCICFSMAPIPKLPGAEGDKAEDRLHVTMNFHAPISTWSIIPSTPTIALTSSPNTAKMRNRAATPLKGKVAVRIAPAASQATLMSRRKFACPCRNTISTTSRD